MQLHRFCGLGAALAPFCLVACSAEPSPVVESSRIPAPDAAPLPEAAAPCPEASTETVRVSNAFGDLEGTLIVPAGCAPHPLVVIAPGSGPTDRDASPAGTYRLLAEALTDRNVATLRYDKAGVGPSRYAVPKREDEITFLSVAQDLGLWIKALRHDERFGRIGIAGHSEGALTGLLVAQEEKLDFFVSLAGAGRPLGILLREQLGRSLSGALFEEAGRIISSLERGQYVNDVSSELAALFRPSVQPYLASWMKFDPASEIAHAPADLGIVQGTTDIQVKVIDAELLAAARPDATLRIVTDMNHMLKHATSQSASQNRAYKDPTLPIVTDVVDLIERTARGTP